MKELELNELQNINGGFGPWTIVGIGAGIITLVGIIDGYVRPPACN